MKFLRLKISADILESIDFDYLLEYFEEIELLDFFHYDKNNFFTLERVVFKPKYVDRWREILEETHKISFFDLIDKKRNQITAIMNISRKASFFPLVGSQAWAIVPPTTLDDHSIHIN